MKLIHREEFRPIEEHRINLRCRSYSTNERSTRKDEYNFTSFLIFLMEINNLKAFDAFFQLFKI